MGAEPGSVGTKPNYPLIAASVLVAVGFSGLIGYLYLNEPQPSGPIQVVRAPDEPHRMVPDDPGGLDVAHQDSPALNKENPARLALGDAPEEPIERPSLATETLQQVPVKPQPVAAPDTNQQETPETVRASAAQSSPSPSQEPAKPAAGSAMAEVFGEPFGPEEWAVQVAAFSRWQQAVTYSERLARDHRDLFGDKRFHIVRAEKLNKTFFRLRAGPYADGDTARQTCAALEAKKKGCLTIRPGS